MYRSDFKDHSVSKNQFSEESIAEIESMVFKNNRYHKFKRVLDLVIFFILLLPTLIIIVIFGMAIKLDSPGPIFYVHERVGRHMKRFNAFKLRSMYFNPQYNGPQFTQEGDRRITRVGKFIRRFRIDELPQIFNVFKGEMSFIGPRPLAPYEYKFSHPIFEKRTIVKPGITGLAQVEGGNDFTNFEKFIHDMKYIQGLSFKNDLRLVIQTIQVILTGKGSR